MMKSLLRKILYKFSYFNICKETQGTAAPVGIWDIICYRFFKHKTGIYWPVHVSSKVSSPQNIEIGIGTAPGLSPGCYIQGIGGVKIGDYTIIAPNVGIISANHDVYNFEEHKCQSVQIGDYCWIGMNSVVLPGSRLGERTIVAACSVVKGDFSHGFCVLAGNPARIVKFLDREKCVNHVNRFEYLGFLKKV
ncbi:acyltransferase [Shewanella rhizosphaerae]|uniref:acyltransferase n=1 Tax=Shewanella rhizosphaerae TaxID=2864207 RepID=UPI001C6592DC|nr:acyltransferase [Shewanella rhizosphaerae]QYK14255.1 acyltransferase [Shewanella rhizosphaerae]